MVDASTKECRQQAKTNRRYWKERDDKKKDKVVNRIQERVKQERLTPYLKPALKRLVENKSNG